MAACPCGCAWGVVWRRRATEQPWFRLRAGKHSAARVIFAENLIKVAGARVESHRGRKNQSQSFVKLVSSVTALKIKGDAFRPIGCKITQPDFD